MKAILLAAGLGTRLRPITDTLPKCLVPLNGQPLLGLWIDKLVQLGVDEILINTHYFSEQVEAFVANSPYHERITLSYEPELMGTAGTLIRNRTFWQNQTCMVIHADNYCQSSLVDMLEAHNQRQAQTDATLLLFETPTPRSCGIVKLDDNQVIQEFHEKVEHPPGNLASGALFIFSPQVYERYFSHLEAQRPYELSLDVVPSMIGKLQGWLVDDHYLDIGTPDSYAQAQNMAQKAARHSSDAGSNLA
ncbi:mannose-1-phosphate guanylyltransferase [Pseudoalteromonas rubra]|uniref:Mannose-1-phosphate guanylyltransferase n=1 Tax=Pseudoalteromonas rubra TaxID=43658 RepID=A0A5S3WKV6_9GAMM|nr:nucleotidyltransferase family protein [Pseudoalteromonas rubra]TMP27117.1 mannose-1-phosphate guanylyltransferase [Pseudoalteromonas rubra]TMP36118.1 mannose-1-phosphate guanylyltransferase [Pseudoalteromonas rubra]